MYDYVAGKADWGSFGLPLEGQADTRTRVGRVARADAPTCRPDELVSGVAGRITGDWRICAVTDERGVVLGVLGPRTLSSGVDARAEDAMAPGPSTIRPSARVAEVAQRMRDNDLTSVIVTRPDGVLVGVVKRTEVDDEARRYS